MGIYLNPGSDKFQEALRSAIYVDKSGMIAYTNRIFKSSNKYICVSRPRRFGKSMAANMLSAYYDRTVDGSMVFRELDIAGDADFDTYRNQCDVLFLNMQEFLSRSMDMVSMLDLLKRRILHDVLREYPDVEYFDRADMIGCLGDVYAETNCPFVVIIDEWDCVFREYRNDYQAQRQYLDFLRDWLKDKAYIGLAYMTGILPIKKYGTHSALNMFTEFSMTNPRELTPFVGFTAEEVRQLCEQYHMDYEETMSWYDGYQFRDMTSICNPRSVVSAMESGILDTYWTETETFEALKIYIDMNFSGLRDTIVKLMAGGRQKIDTRSFVNDMTTFHSADDVLTLLVHLGYLGYDFDTKEVFIPNREIMGEYVTATRVSQWSEIVHSVLQSDKLLQATWNGDEEAVAKGMEEAHLNTSHLQYNDENALSYTVSLAYYSARQYYTIIRELPTGKGFADMVFLPKKKYADKPAMIVELKWDDNADTALRQIRDKYYTEALKDYKGNILCVGITYDRGSKKHTCRIEKETI